MVVVVVVSFTDCVLLYLYLVSKFAREKIRPLVTEMDEKGHMPQHLIKDLFDNGVMITVFTGTTL